MPIAITAKSIPSANSGIPKVKRCAPVFTSVPIVPRRMPSRIIPTALTTEPFARMTAAIKPKTIKEK
jgi:hypothetical protein